MPTLTELLGSVLTSVNYSFDVLNVLNLKSLLPHLFFHGSTLCPKHTPTVSLSSLLEAPFINYVIMCLPNFDHLRSKYPF